MGSSTVKVTILGPSREEEVELLVDTGSIYTWVRKEVLLKLGLKPEGKRKFKTIDGRTLERDVAEAGLKFENERATTVVVFAERGDAEVLGVYALEGLAMEVDPITKTLRKVEALLAV